MVSLSGKRGGGDTVWDGSTGNMNADALRLQTKEVVLNCLFGCEQNVADLGPIVPATIEANAGTAESLFVVLRILVHGDTPRS
jgi:hypothetical protein